MNPSNPQKESKLFWGKQITTSYSRIDDIIDRINKLSIFSLLAFSIIGKGAFVLYIIEAYTRTILPFRELFFDRIDLYIFLFWLSILIDLYLFYRLTITAEQKLNIQTAYTKVLMKNSRLDVSRYYTKAALTVVEHSWNVVKKYNQNQLLPFHFFITLLDTPEIREMFARLNIHDKDIIDILARQLHKHERSKDDSKPTEISSSATEILIYAGRVALSEHKERVDVITLFQAIVDKGQLVQNILYEFDIEEEKIRNTISWIRSRKDILKEYQSRRFRSRLKPRNEMDRAMTGLQTPFASRMSTDMTLLSKRGYFHPFINRDTVLERVFQSLESQKNVLIMGASGVGKASVIEGIAGRMATEDVPAFLKDKRLIRIDATRIISGSGVTQSIEKLTRLFDEVVRAGNIVLVIEHIDRLVGITTGGSQSLDLADVIGTLINKKLVYVIGTAEPAHYETGASTTALSQIFRIISLEETNKNDTIRILASKTLVLEGKYHVFFTYGAIEELYRLTSRYLPKEHLPKKAVDLLDEIAVSKKGTAKKVEKIEHNDIARILSRKIHIPLTDVGDAEREKLLNLEVLIHKQIISQDAAISSVANALRRARTDMKKADRPIATLLFLGPTGVGKTALAKTVSEIYFGTEYHMTRLDMNEFQTKDSIHTLIGGKGETGALTRSLEENPFGLLLLDEIEKADKDIINVFLQLMDEGHIIDGRGVRIDATNILFVATSNAGSQFIQDKLRAGIPVAEITKELAETQLKQYFLPEFLNRFDDIIVFNTLSVNDMKDITRLAVVDIKKTLEDNHGITLIVEDDAIAYLAKEGYKEEYGARQLHRTMQHIINDPISKILLTKQAKRRDTIRVTGEGVFKIETAETL